MFFRKQFWNILCSPRRASFHMISTYGWYWKSLLIRKGWMKNMNWVLNLGVLRTLGTNSFGLNFRVWEIREVDWWLSKAPSSKNQALELTGVCVCESCPGPWYCGSWASHLIFLSRRLCIFKMRMRWGFYSLITGWSCRKQLRRAQPPAGAHRMLVLSKVVGILPWGN